MKIRHRVHKDPLIQPTLNINFISYFPISVSVLYPIHPRSQVHSFPLKFPLHSFSSNSHVSSACYAFHIPDLPNKLTIGWYQFKFRKDITHVRVQSLSLNTTLAEKLFSIYLNNARNPPGTAKQLLIFSVCYLRHTWNNSLINLLPGQTSLSASN
jgi:hypothetical protein